MEKFLKRYEKTSNTTNCVYFNKICILCTIHSKMLTKHRHYCQICVQSLEIFISNQAKCTKNSGNTRQCKKNNREIPWNFTEKYLYY